MAYTSETDPVTQSSEDSDTTLALRKYEEEERNAKLVYLIIIEDWDFSLEDS